jgi:hypothetical protein
MGRLSAGAIKMNYRMKSLEELLIDSFRIKYNAKGEEETASLLLSVRTNRATYIPLSLIDEISMKKQIFKPKNTPSEEKSK